MLSTLARHGRFVTPVRGVARFHRGEWLHHLARPITVLCAGRQCLDAWNGPRGHEVALVGRECDATHPHLLLFKLCGSLLAVVGPLVFARCLLCSRPDAGGEE